MTEIIPAILAPVWSDIEDKIKLVDSLADWVQIDIGDGKFIDQVTWQTPVDLELLPGKVKTEIHLMVESPEKYFEDCKGIGAKRVIFHLEAAKNPAEVLQKMEECGFQKEIALNPPTPVSKLAPYVERLDAVMVMSVNPGFQQQEFISDVLSKVSEIRRLKQDILVGIDGGINEQTIKQAFGAGVDYACAGSAVMKSSDPVAALKALQEIIS